MQSTANKIYQVPNSHETDTSCTFKFCICHLDCMKTKHIYCYGASSNNCAEKRIRLSIELKIKYHSMRSRKKKHFVQPIIIRLHNKQNVLWSMQYFLWYVEGRSVQLSIAALKIAKEKMADRLNDEINSKAIWNSHKASALVRNTSEA